MTAKIKNQENNNKRLYDFTHLVQHPPVSHILYPIYVLYSIFPIRSGYISKVVSGNAC